MGTNKANAEVGANPETQLKYYLDRQRKTGDLHGPGPGAVVRERTDALVAGLG